MANFSLKPESYQNNQSKRATTTKQKDEIVIINKPQAAGANLA